MTVSIREKSFSVELNLQEIIVQILAKGRHITIGEITQQARKKGAKVTFQAIRKAVLALKVKGTVQEQERRYSLSRLYIIYLKHLSDRCVETYLSGEAAKIPAYLRPEQNYTQFIFSDLILADRFWAEVVYDWIGSAEDKGFYFNGPHCWYPFGHLGLEREFLLRIKEAGIAAYYLVDNDMPQDRTVGKFYTDHGVTYLSRKSKAPTKSAMAVLGDSIVEFGYPQDILMRLGKIFRKKSVDLTEIAGLLREKTEITLTVTYNKAIAEAIRESIRKEFQEGKKG